MTETIQLGDIDIAVRRKDVKHVHLSVHPPSGRVVSRNAAAARRLDEGMDNSLAKLKLIKDSGDAGRMAYDQMLGDSPAGNKMVQDAVDALVAQTRATEAIVATLGVVIALEGSDSLDNPSAVQ